MLNRDIYQHIALSADLTTLKILLQCGEEFMDAVNNNLFWERKFSGEHIPFIYTRQRTLDEWIHEYEHAINIVTAVKNYLKIPVVIESGKIYIHSIELSTARKILFDHKRANDVYDLIVKYYQETNARGRINLCITSYNNFLNSKISVELYSELIYGIELIDVYYDDVVRILYLSKQLKEVVTSTS